MRSLFLLSLAIVAGVCWASPSAYAQACGPDAAPPQAAFNGYNCEIYRWGSGDTAAEIDSAQTYLPGFKWYYGTTFLNGHATVSGDYSLSGSNIVQQTSVAADHGAYVLNTCGSGASSGPPHYTVGQPGLKSAGWYMEGTYAWNATGNTGVQTGFYSTDQLQPGPQDYEIDNPDAQAFDQSVLFDGSQNNNDSGHTFFAPTVETGSHRYGAMSTNSAFTWWINDVANGSVIFTHGSASDLFSRGSRICWGSESTEQYSFTLISLKIWQPNGGSARNPAGVAVVFLMSILLAICLPGAWQLGTACRRRAEKVASL